MVLDDVHAERCHRWPLDSDAIDLLQGNLRRTYPDAERSKHRSCTRNQRLSDRASPPCAGYAILHIEKFKLQKVMCSVQGPPSLLTHVHFRKTVRVKAASR